MAEIRYGVMEDRWRGGSRQQQQRRGLGGRPGSCGLGVELPAAETSGGVGRDTMGSMVNTAGNGLGSCFSVQQSTTPAWWNWASVSSGGVAGVGETVAAVGAMNWINWAPWVQILQNENIYN